MRLSVKGMAVAAALVWGGLAMFLTGVANLAWGYGEHFLKLMASVYPGYDGPGDFGQVVVGALYGALDGAIAGGLFAWLYNLFAARRPAA
ncbi:MAG: hypothetical protein ACE5JG_08540 [Planctomycetota bacterium]